MSYRHQWSQVNSIRVIPQSGWLQVSVCCVVLITKIKRRYGLRSSVLESTKQKMLMDVAVCPDTWSVLRVHFCNFHLCSGHFRWECWMYHLHAVGSSHCNKFNKMSHWCISEPACNQKKLSFHFEMCFSFSKGEMYELASYQLRAIWWL